jgi:CheY-like chemotaxis protein
MLLRHGMEVREAETAQQGLMMVDAEPPDLVLMDLQLPGMGGMEAMRQLRKRQGPIGQTPVIALTANALIGDRESYLTAGMNGYVSKPFTTDALIAEISRVVDQQVFIVDRAEGTTLASAPDAMSTPQVPSQFVRALDSINGELGLFVLVAEKAVSEFQLTADRLDACISASDLPGLTRLAHKLCSVWALYAKVGEEDLAAQVETYAKGGRREVTLMLATQLVAALQDAAQSLLAWLSQVKGENNNG